MKNCAARDCDADAFARSAGRVDYVDPLEFGFNRDTGAQSAGNQAIGWYGGSTTSLDIRQYLVFDRSSINGTVVAATLRLEDLVSGYFSVDPQEGWTLFDVTTPGRRVRCWRWMPAG